MVFEDFSARCGVGSAATPDTRNPAIQKDITAVKRKLFSPGHHESCHLSRALGQKKPVVTTAPGVYGSVAARHAESARTIEVAIWRSGMLQYFLRSRSFSRGETFCKPRFS